MTDKFEKERKRLHNICVKDGQSKKQIKEMDDYWKSPSGKIVLELSMAQDKKIETEFGKQPKRGCPTRKKHK